MPHARPLRAARAPRRSEAAARAAARSRASPASRCRRSSTTTCTCTSSTSDGSAARRDRRRRRPRRRSRRPRSPRRATGMPRVAYAGAFLTAPGGYPVGAVVGARRRSCARCSDPVDPSRRRRGRGDRGRRAGVVRSIRHQGRAQRRRPGRSSTPPRSRPIVARARERGLPVVAHVEGAGMTRLALDAGVDALAHTPFTEALDADAHRAARSRAGQRWISTLDIHRDDPESARRSPAPTSTAFVAAGGRVLYGTDLGNGDLPVGVNARELAALARSRRARRGAHRRAHRPVAGRGDSSDAVATFVPGDAARRRSTTCPPGSAARPSSPPRS